MAFKVQNKKIKQPDFVSQIMAYEGGEMTPEQEDKFIYNNRHKLRNLQGHYGRELARRGY